ncbi:MAG: hypothetical protein NT080_08220 [Spirochaetes bacterium]|nr:hypothetical protein [Spirochaetota bacterium]
MKKSIFVILMLLALCAPAFSETFWDACLDWLKLCNLTIGPAFFMPEGVGDPNSYDFHIVDGFGDDYYFSNDYSEKTQPSGIGVAIRMPFYYTDRFSLGVTGFSIADAVSGFGVAMAGLYATGSVGSFSISAGAGVAGAFVSHTIGRLYEAFPGDPGAYLDGVFFAPGSTMTVMACSSRLKPSATCSFKYRIMPWLYAEAGTTYFPDLTIDEFTYSLDNEDGGETTEVFSADPRTTIWFPSFWTVFVGFGVGY